MNIAAIFRRLPKFFRRHKLVKLLLFLSPQSRIQLVEFNSGARLYADISDLFPRSYFVSRSFEPEFFSIAMPFLLKGGVFFDAGANFGFCTFGMIQALQGTNVAYHLFEANREACELMRRSAEFYPDHKIVINHCAISDHLGISHLFLKAGHLSGSYISGEGSQEVSNLKLDDYIVQQDIRRIDFLKMDIEGSEPLAFLGAAGSLRSGIIKIIYFEVSSETLSRLNFSEANCLSPLNDAGFRLFYVKKDDFDQGVPDPGLTFDLNVNGIRLRLSPLVNALNGHQTDILAIHPSSEYFKAANAS